MTTRDDGGPVFPRIGEGFGNPNYDHPGMSLRDWFASNAPPVPEGWIGSDPDSNTRICNWVDRADSAIAALIEWRWYYADAMLLAREGK